MQIIAAASNMGRKQNLAHFSYMGEEFGPKGIALVVVVVGVREIVGIGISSLDRIALERNYWDIIAIVGVGIIVVRVNSEEVGNIRLCQQFPFERKSDQITIRWLSPYIDCI